MTKGHPLSPDPSQVIASAGPIRGRRVNLPSSRVPPMLNPAGNSDPMSRRALVPPAAPAAFTEQAGGSLAARFPLRIPLRPAVITALVVAALCGVGAALLSGLADAGDIWREADTLSDGAGRIRWGLVPLVGALATLHYLCSALGVRAAADGVAGRRRLALWEVAAAQFAGAAANRLAPGGLGSAAVTCRYLTRRGLLGCEAAAAVAAAGLLRAVTKLALFAVAVVAWNHLGSAAAPAVDLRRLGAQHSQVLLPAAGAVTATALALTAAGLCWRRARERARTAAAGVIGSLRHIGREPRALLTSVTASAGAHTMLALAFAVSMVAVPGVRGDAFGPLLALYLIGATAGAAIPTPAGVGSTEAALIATLAAANVPAAHAAQGVLLFRLMTFWAPIPVGIVSTRLLRRHDGL